MSADTDKWYVLKPPGLGEIRIDRDLARSPQHLNDLGVVAVKAIREAPGIIQRGLNTFESVDELENKITGGKSRAGGTVSTTGMNIKIARGALDVERLITHEIVESSLIWDRWLRGKTERTPSEYLEDEEVVNQKTERLLTSPWV